MIDTVGVCFPISPTRKHLYSWVGTPKIFPDGTRKERYIQNVALETGARVDFEYYPVYGTYNEPCLKIWLSLPKALFGENVSIIESDEELQMSIDSTNEHLSTLSWLPDVDLLQGFLYRLDCAYNHFVGDRLPDYIEAFFHLEFPRRDTKPYYPHQGVQFYSKVSTTSFYDKYAESRLPQAKGILRH